MDETRTPNVAGLVQSAGKPGMPLRIVRPIFSLHPKEEVNAGIFARLDDSIRAELASLSKESVQQHTILLQAFLNWALGNLDADAYAALQNKYTDIKHPNSKFLNFTYYCRSKMPQLANLGLHRARSKQILDIGCGPGHFQLMARYFGHEAFGLDLPFEANHIYNALCEFFGVSKVDHRIEAMQPLPTFSQRFDLVTVFLANFNLDANGPWGEEPWRFFVEDVCVNLLKPNGNLYLTLTGGRWSADAWRYLLSVSEWTHNDRVALIRRDQKTKAAIEAAQRARREALSQRIRNRDEKLHKLQERIRERDEQVQHIKTSYTEKLRKRDEQVQHIKTSYTEKLRKRDEKLHKLHERIRERDEQIQQIESSFSWRRVMSFIRSFKTVKR